MLIIDRWKDLLLTENVFELQNLWQLVLTFVLLILTSRLLKAKSDNEIAQGSNPFLWVKRNRSFLTFWVLIASIFGVCSYLKFETPIFRFFSILGGIWILIGLVTSLIPRLFWARSAATVAYFMTGALGISNIDTSIQTLRSLNLSIGSTTILPIW